MLCWVCLVLCWVCLGVGVNHNKGVLYYLDGTVQYGALVVEFSIDYIHKFIPKEILASNSDLP